MLRRLYLKPETRLFECSKGVLFALFLKSIGGRFKVRARQERGPRQYSAIVPQIPGA